MGTTVILVRLNAPSVKQVSFVHHKESTRDFAQGLKLLKMELKNVVQRPLDQPRPVVRLQYLQLAK